jgi:hypothetical protein
MSIELGGSFLTLFSIFRSQDLFNEGDSPHLFAWFSSSLNKKTNSDKLQLLSLLSAISCVTESVVPGHITHSAFLHLDNESNSINYSKTVGEGNAIASFCPLTSRSNGPRLVTIFAKRYGSKRPTFSFPISNDSNKRRLFESAQTFNAMLVNSIVSVIGHHILSEHMDPTIWEKASTIVALQSICAFLSTNNTPIVSIQAVTPSLQSTIEEGVKQIHEAKEAAFKSFTRAATGSHYQPPFRSSQRTPNSFSPTFFSRRSPLREIQVAKEVRPSIYGELNLLEAAAERTLSAHKKELNPQIDIISSTLESQESPLNSSSILQVEEQPNIIFDISASNHASYWIVFSAALLYAQDSPPFLLAHTSRESSSVDNAKWTVLRSVEAVLISKREDLKFAFKNSSGTAGLSIPVCLPPQPTIDIGSNFSSSDEVNASAIRHHGEEALLRSPFKNNLHILLNWRSVVSLNHSMALLESQSQASEGGAVAAADENFVVTLLLIASEKGENDVHEGIDSSLQNKFATILLSTAGTLAANESLSLLARASSTLRKVDNKCGEILESKKV